MATVANDAVRRAILRRLCADAELTALVPKARIYPEQPPALPSWPFVQYGIDIDLPRRASCLDGQAISVSIHSFAKGPGTDGIVAIGRAIAQALDRRRLALEGGAYLRVRYAGGRTLRDSADTNSWHRITNLQVQVYA